MVYVQRVAASPRTGDTVGTLAGHSRLEAANPGVREPHNCRLFAVKVSILSAGPRISGKRFEIPTLPAAEGASPGFLHCDGGGSAGTEVAR